MHVDMSMYMDTSIRTQQVTKVYPGGELIDVAFDNGEEMFGAPRFDLLPAQVDLLMLAYMPALASLHASCYLPLVTTYYLTYAGGVNSAPSSGVETIQHANSLCLLLRLTNEYIRA